MRSRWLAIALLSLCRPVFAGDPPVEPAGAAQAAEAARAAEEAERGGDHEKAVELYRRALRLAVDAMTRLEGLAGARDAESRSCAAALFEIGARAASKIEDAAALVFFLEAGRAGSLLQGLVGREALRGTVVPKALADLETEARDAEGRALLAYAAAIHAGELAAIRARREEFLAARDAWADALERIERESRLAAGVLAPRPETIAEIRGHLREGEALVAYALLEGRALAQVITKDAARTVPLAKTETIAEAVEVLAVSSRDADPAASVDDLRAFVVAPLALGPEVKRVLVSPDGVLSFVPFALLLGDREVAYVPSGSTYGLLLAERAKKGVGVLAVGDPDYAGDAAAPTDVLVRRGRRFQPLPATRAEATAVGDVLLLGKDATEARLAAALATRPRWSALHIAGHGLVDVERPMFSAMVLTPAGKDDGLLTALEVLRMRVPADLVVLSASRSALGKVFRGEGVLGLVRAFLYAGTPRVIGSLWDVDDDATSALMTKFHAARKAGTSTAKSLKDAQSFVASQPKWKHPYYWAPWVLWGLAD